METQWVLGGFYCLFVCCICKATSRDHPQQRQKNLMEVISLPRHPQQISGWPLASKASAGVCMWSGERVGSQLAPLCCVVGESSGSGGAHPGSTASLAV